MVGTVVSSSSICVASRCSFVAAGVGAAQSQNITDPELGPALLALVERGLMAQQALDTVVEGTDNIEWRQLGLVDSTGGTACYSGSETLGIYASAQGENCCAMGNMLANADIPVSMVRAFDESTSLSFPERLLAAIEGGLDAGGEAGPIHSAAILVADLASWPVVNLRVDWDDKPDNAIPQLRHIWNNYAPQMQAYITRAVDPANSESYGVPGDE